MKLSELAQVFGWRPAPGRRRRTAPERLRPTTPQRQQATGQNVFLRERPWTPPRIWCTVTAYFQYGQPTVLWSGGADSPRLAVRALRDQVQGLAVALDLRAGDEQRRWLDTPAAMERAADDLGRGRSYAIAITHDRVVYIINATRSARPETATEAGTAPPRDRFCSV